MTKRKAKPSTVRKWRFMDAWLTLGHAIWYWKWPLLLAAAALAGIAWALFH